ncbi:MAG: hypothetical protein IKN64_02905 [Desulfovibrio sp.]|nr:hypothetical protein [Desulfovibrio sp.]
MNRPTGKIAPFAGFMTFEELCIRWKHIAEEVIVDMASTGELTAYDLKRGSADKQSGAPLNEDTIVCMSPVLAQLRLAEDDFGNTAVVTVDGMLKVGECCNPELQTTENHTIYFEKCAVAELEERCPQFRPEHAEQLPQARITGLEAELAAAKKRIAELETALAEQKKVAGQTDAALEKRLTNTEERWRDAAPAMLKLTWHLAQAEPPNGCWSMKAVKEEAERWKEIKDAMVRAVYNAIPEERRCKKNEAK